MSAVTADLISRARAGDGDAFRELTEPYRRELQVHCYRMLGSFQDAEDALQDTLLAALQSLSGFEGRASLRTWFYRIATSRCLNARRWASRGPTLIRLSSREATRVEDEVAGAQEESLAKQFRITCWAGRCRNVSRSDSNAWGLAGFASKLTSHQ